MTTKKNEDLSKYKNYVVKGFNILVEMEMIPDTLGNGVLVRADTDKDRLQTAHPRGYIRAIGKNAWADKGEHYAKIGDKVVFKRYAGTDVNRTLEGSLPTNEPLLRVMEDIEILAVIEE